MKTLSNFQFSTTTTTILVNENILKCLRTKWEYWSRLGQLACQLSTDKSSKTGRAWTCGVTFSDFRARKYEKWKSSRVGEVRAYSKYIIFRSHPSGVAQWLIVGEKLYYYCESKLLYLCLDTNPNANRTNESFCSTRKSFECIHIQIDTHSKRSTMFHSFITRSHSCPFVCRPVGNSHFHWCLMRQHWTRASNMIGY